MQQFAIFVDPAQPGHGVLALPCAAQGGTVQTAGDTRGLLLVGYTAGHTLHRTFLKGEGTPVLMHDHFVFASRDCLAVMGKTVGGTPPPVRLHGAVVQHSLHGQPIDASRPAGMALH